MPRMKVAPLPGGMMVLGMMGFLIVTVYTAYGTLSPTWGFTLGFVFALIFLATIISAVQAPVEESPFHKGKHM